MNKKNTKTQKDYFITQQFLFSMTSYIILYICLHHDVILRKNFKHGQISMFHEILSHTCVSQENP